MTAYNGQAYISKVINRNGYVVMLPNVGSMSDLLQTNPPNPYAESASQLFPLGTKLIQGERVWRYCKNGSGTPGAGAALQAAIVKHSTADLDVVVDAASDIGATTISLTSKTAIAVVKDYYKEGYVFVNVSTGIGHCYKIKTHDAMVANDTGEIFTLYDGLVIALASSASQVGLRKNQFDSVIVTPTPLTGIPVGISPLALTASNYFWVQTGGPCAAITNTAITIGAGVIVGSTNAKVDPGVDNEAALQRIGFCLVAPDQAAEAALIFLTLDR